MCIQCVVSHRCLSVPVVKSVIVRLHGNMFPSAPPPDRAIKAPQAPKLQDSLTAIVSGAFICTLSNMISLRTSSSVFSGSLLISKPSDSSQQCVQPLFCLLPFCRLCNHPVLLCTSSCRSSMGTFAVVSTIWRSLRVSFCLINSPSLQLLSFFLK